MESKYLIVVVVKTTIHLPSPKNLNLPHVLFIILLIIPHLFFIVLLIIHYLYRKWLLIIHLIFYFFIRLLAINYSSYLLFLYSSSFLLFY
jgi:hypothetical protein